MIQVLNTVTILVTTTIDVKTHPKGANSLQWEGL